MRNSKQLLITKVQRKSVCLKKIFDLIKFINISKILKNHLSSRRKISHNRFFLTIIEKTLSRNIFKCTFTVLKFLFCTCIPFFLLILFIFSFISLRSLMILWSANLGIESPQTALIQSVLKNKNEIESY